ncbi:hypothetical protein StoSoilA2_23740 [Arthrobacter sp. StoSoilA2]|nr:hypothetical protein StoSoilA2_23740 [Arthrobacter sp. StoSoilA2]
MGEVLRPEGIKAVDRACDPAVESFVRVSARLALLHTAAPAFHGGRLRSAACQVAKDVGVDSEEGQKQHDDATTNPATYLRPTAHASAASVFYLGWVKLRTVIETHTVRIDVTVGAVGRTLP